MILCENCFVDPVLVDLVKRSKAIIDRKKYNNCPCCGKNNPLLHDFRVPESVSSQLTNILDLYIPADNPVNGTYLIDELKYRWRIISKSISKAEVIHLLKEIILEYFEYKNDPFCCKVMLTSDLINEENIIFTPKGEGSFFCIIDASWKFFEESVKLQNRYFSDVINKKVFQTFCDYLTRPVEKDQLFYRARVSSSNHSYSYEEIYAPPKGKSNEGRLNAKGEWCLYLSSDEDTCIHEVRTVAHDYVCVGKFRLKEKIRVVDFSLIDTTISPFIEEMDVKLYLCNIDCLRKIRNLFSKVVRSNSSALNYITTQFIADCIRSIKESKAPNSNYKFAGISYPSTVARLDFKGTNYAIFQEDLFELDRPTVLYEITDVSYTKIEIQDN